MPWHRTRNLLLGLVSLLCLGFAGWVGYSLLLHPERFSAAIGGPFTLTDTRGASVSDESFRGRFMLRSAAAWERAGTVLRAMPSGVLFVEATKQLHRTGLGVEQVEGGTGLRTSDEV